MTRTQGHRIPYSLGIFGADGLDHPKPGGNDIQTLRVVLADPDHFTAAARAVDAVRFDDLDDPFEFLRQTAMITFGGTALPG